jgi:hypothetical protein
MNSAVAAVLNCEEKKKKKRSKEALLAAAAAVRKKKRGGTVPATHPPPPPPPLLPQNPHREEPAEGKRIGRSKEETTKMREVIEVVAAVMILLRPRKT